MNVDQILQSKGSKVFTVRGDAKVAEAVRVLNAENIGAVVILDNADNIVGILSERDIVRTLRSDETSAMFAPVSNCMTPNPVTCTPESELGDLMQTMTDRRVRHIPVVRDGKLAGLVSIGDVVKRKIEEAENEAAAMREYIST